MIKGIFKQIHRKHLYIQEHNHITKRYFSNFDSLNPYNVLGVNKNDDIKLIHKRWLELSRKYHPDINSDEKASDIVKKINAAYQSIKTEKSRPNTNESQSNEDMADKTEKYHSKQRSSDQSNTSQFTEKEKPKTREERVKEKVQTSRRTEEEILYEEIFGYSYKDDPAFFYKSENESLRKEYEEEINKLKMQRQESNENKTQNAQNVKSENSNSYSKRDEDENSSFHSEKKESAEDRYHDQNKSEIGAEKVSKKRFSGRMMALAICVAGLPFLYIMEEAISQVL